MCDTGHMAVHPHPHPHGNPLSNGTQRQSRASTPTPQTLSSVAQVSHLPLPLGRLFIGRSNWECVELETTEIALSLTLCLSVPRFVCLCCCLLAWKLCRHVHAPGHKKARLIIKSRPLLRPPTQMNINGRKLCRAPSLGFSVRAC